jgi:hypothetical protein
MRLLFDSIRQLRKSSDRGEAHLITKNRRFLDPIEHHQDKLDISAPASIHTQQAKLGIALDRVLGVLGFTTFSNISLDFI